MEEGENSVKFRKNNVGELAGDFFIYVHLKDNDEKFTQDFESRKCEYTLKVKPDTFEGTE
jgi:hypothetical protein